MEEFNFIEYLRTEKRLNNYQIGKIQELLDSFVKDDSHSHVSFEFCPKCGKFHPHVIRSGFAGSGKQLTDARNVADAFHMIMVLSPGIRIRMQTSGRHSSSTLLRVWAWKRPAAGFQ